MQRGCYVLGETLRSFAFAQIRRGSRTKLVSRHQQSAFDYSCRTNSRRRNDVPAHAIAARTADSGSPHLKPSKSRTSRPPKQGSHEEHEGSPPSGLQQSTAGAETSAHKEGPAGWTGPWEPSNGGLDGDQTRILTTRANATRSQNSTEQSDVKLPSTLAENTPALGLSQS